MTQNQIADRSDLKKYRTEIPNMVDDLGLSVYAFRLYVHFKRVTGETGTCFQSTATIAKTCKMSAGMVTKAKTELLQAGLITLTVKKGEHGEFDSHIIEIVDIWPQNFAKYSTYSPHEQDRSHGDTVPSHDVNSTVSPHETKKEPIKKEPIKKGTRKTRATYETDERSRHPAILCVKGVTGRYPIKTNYDQVIEALGDTPDGTKAAECYKWWTFGGRNAAGLGWLDWYTNGIPEWAMKGPATNGNGKAKSAAPQGNVQRPAAKQEGDRSLRI